MLVCAGISFSASGFLIPQLEDPAVGFGITSDDGSWIASILEIGSLSGAIFGGLLSEKLGRRRSLMNHDRQHFLLDWNINDYFFQKSEYDFGQQIYSGSLCHFCTCGSTFIHLRNQST